MTLSGEAAVVTGAWSDVGEPTAPARLGTDWTPTHLPRCSEQAAFTSLARRKATLLSTSDSPRP